MPARARYPSRVDARQCATMRIAAMRTPAKRKTTPAPLPRRVGSLRTPSTPPGRHIPWRDCVVRVCEPGVVGQSAIRTGNRPRGPASPGDTAMRRLMRCGEAYVAFRTGSAGEGDRVDAAAVVRLAAMSGTAVAVEARGIRVGAEAEVVDLRDSGTTQPGDDIAGEIEQRVMGARRGRKKPLAAGILRLEALDQIAADLVVRLPDHRAERGDHPRAVGAELL